MRRFDAALRRATPKGHKTFISCTAAHQESRLPRYDSSLRAWHTNAMGLTEYLVVYGTARITEGGAAELLQELAYTYLGPGVRFPPAGNPPPGYITHIKVNRVSGVGPWAAGH